MLPFSIEVYKIFHKIFRENGNFKQFSILAEIFKILKTIANSAKIFRIFQDFLPRTIGKLKRLHLRSWEGRILAKFSRYIKKSMKFAILEIFHNLRVNIFNSEAN